MQRGRIYGLSYFTAASRGSGLRTPLVYIVGIVNATCGFFWSTILGIRENQSGSTFDRKVNIFGEVLFFWYVEVW